MQKTNKHFSISHVFLLEASDISVARVRRLIAPQIDDALDALVFPNVDGELIEKLYERLADVIDEHGGPGDAGMAFYSWLGNDVPNYQDFLPGDMSKACRVIVDAWKKLPSVGGKGVR